MQTDLLVVGAGPAGLACARTAHDRGLAVEVIDKAVFPRDKTCGDGLTTQALRLLERLGVDVTNQPGYQAITETVIFSPRGRSITLPLPEQSQGAYSGVMARVDLDFALLQRTRDSGVLVREGVGLESLSVGTQSVTAGLSDGNNIVAKYLVAADGHWSSVRRLQLGRKQKDLGSWHAVRQYFCNVESPTNKPAQWIFFEPDILPGYAWVFSLPNGRANVGFTVLRREHQHGKDLRALWEDLVNRSPLRSVLGENAEPEENHRAWPIPASYHPSRCAQGRVLYVGDAAGVVDPLTGEGIAQALETGILAGEAVQTNQSPEQVSSRYQHAVERVIGRDLRFAKRFQRLLHSPARAEAGLRIASGTAWTRRNFARWMFEDYPRAMAITPDRWRRGMFSEPGAFCARPIADKNCLG